MVSDFHIHLGSVRRQACTLLIAVMFSMLCSVEALAQEIRTSISAQQMGLQNTIVYTVETQGAVQSISPPQSRDFEVVGQSTQTSVSFINGKSIRRLVASFELSPLKEGSLQTGAATIQLRDGTTSKTQSYAVTVKNDGRPPRRPPATPQVHPPGAPAWLQPTVPPKQSTNSGPFGEYPVLPPVATDELHTQQDLHISPDRPFILPFTNTVTPVKGEPFLVEYLFYEPSMSLGFEATDMDEPAFPNAWYKDVTEQRVAYNQRIVRVRAGGQIYNAQLIRSYMVVPLQDGRYTIPSLTLTISGRTFSGPVPSYDLASSKMNVNVAPLPNNNHAPPPNDNVGRYRLDATVNSKTARVGDTLELTLTVEGIGSPLKIQYPTIDWPALLRTHTPKDNTQTGVGPTGWITTKLERSVAFEAQSEGDFTIPAITLQWYDPWKQAWQSQSTDPIIIRIQGQQPASTSGPRASQEEHKEEETLPSLSWMDELPTADQIPEDWGMIARMRKMGEPWKGTPLYYLLFFLPIVVSLSLISSRLIKSWRRKTEDNRTQLQAKPRALKALRNCTHATADNFAEMNRITRNYLVATGIPGARGATLEELRSTLLAQKPQQDVDTLISLVERVENARYGGMASQDFKVLRGELIRWIQHDDRDEA